ncbi:MAG TPA: hypothetical protein PKV62_02775, partial [Oscillospiraceae bacterium]|nr:hypothetical protein [Oscillospiraceae bacterium]
KGPSCPYCSGGYVSFEFSTDEDLSALVSESSWIRVTGILREGAMYPGGGQDPYPFYYIGRSGWRRWTRSASTP